MPGAASSCAMRRDGNETVTIPVVANVGCDDLSLFAAEEREWSFWKVDRELVDNSGDIVAVRAVGDSMVDAGIESGDYILIQFTENSKTAPCCGPLLAMR